MFNFAKILFVVTFLFALCGFAFGTSGGEVSGTVTFGGNDKPLGGVAMSLQGSAVRAEATSSPAPTAQPVPTISERVEVTTTRSPEDPQDVPSAVEVFGGDQLRNRGYHDLRTALSFATGVEIAPGGDAGRVDRRPT